MSSAAGESDAGDEGANWRLGLKGRSDFGPWEDRSGDSFGFQARIGYHPGVRVYTPPPPPPPPPPPAPTPKPDNVLTVKAERRPIVAAARSWLSQ